MAYKRASKTETALKRAALAMLMVLGSALPFIIAWALIASTNDENPLDNVPNYSDPLHETLNIAPDRMTAARTQYEYRQQVRLIFEGTLTGDDGAQSDAFFTFAAAEGTPLDAPRPTTWAIVAADQALTAAGSDDALVYDKEHVYTLVIDLGSRWQRILFDFAPEISGNGDLRVTVIQLE